MTTNIRSGAGNIGCILGGYKWRSGHIAGGEGDGVRSPGSGESLNTVVGQGAVLVGGTLVQTGYTDLECAGLLLAKLDLVGPAAVLGISVCSAISTTVVYSD